MQSWIYTMEGFAKSMLHNLTLAEVSLVALLALPLDLPLNPQVHLAQSIKIFIVSSHPSFSRISLCWSSIPLLPWDH